MGNRIKLLSPNLAELPVWKEFAEAIDEVFKDSIDDPQLVFRLLRDTFAFGPTEWVTRTESTPEVFDVVDSPRSVFGLSNIVTGYPGTSKIQIYQKATTDPDSEYALISKYDYNGTSDKVVEFITPVAVGQTIKIARRENIPSGAFDIADLHNFHGPTNSYGPQEATALQTIFSTGTIDTGYPTKNRLLVYTKPTMASPDSQYAFVPQSAYYVSGQNEITFLSGQVAGTAVKIVEKPHSVELARKLNQLGFVYNDIDFLSLPTEYDNSDAIQILSDTLGGYYIHTKGTKNFADFFGYCFKAIFRVEQLWSYENGNDEYPVLLPAGNAGIGTPVWNGGTWYPTSHVNLYYDLAKFGNSLNEQAVKDFFVYISPINLVVAFVILEAAVDMGPMYFGGAPTLVTIHYL